MNIENILNKFKQILVDNEIKYGKWKIFLKNKNKVLTNSNENNFF